MIIDRFLTTVEEDSYVERTADRLRDMCAGTSKVGDVDPAVIRERLKRTNRLAERRAAFSGDAA